MKIFKNLSLLILVAAMSLMVSCNNDTAEFSDETQITENNDALSSRAISNRLFNRNVKFWRSGRQAIRFSNGSRGFGKVGYRWNRRKRRTQFRFTLQVSTGMMVDPSYPNTFTSIQDGLHSRHYITNVTWSSFRMDGKIYRSVRSGYTY